MLIYKINDLESKIPYKQWEALKKEFVEFAKEKKQLEKENKHLYEKEELHLNRIDELTDRVLELEANINEAIEVLKRNRTNNPYLETSDLIRLLERGIK